MDFSLITDFGKEKMSESSSSECANIFDAGGGVGRTSSYSLMTEGANALFSCVVGFGLKEPNRLS